MGKATKEEAREWQHRLADVDAAGQLSPMVSALFGQLAGFLRRASAALPSAASVAADRARQKRYRRGLSLDGRGGR